MSRGIGSLVALGALAIGLAGCGGSDAPTSSSKTPLSKAQFVGRADAICEQTTRELAAGAGNASGEELVSKYLLKLKNERNGLNALRAPGELASTFDAYKSAMIAAGEMKARMYEAVHNRATSAEVQRASARQSAAEQRSARLATKLGLKICR